MSSSSSVTKTTTRNYESGGSSGGRSNYSPTTKSRVGGSFKSGNMMSGLPSMGGAGSSGVLRTTTVTYGNKSQHDNMGNAGALAETGARTVQENRTKEKKTMQDLNGRFANYIEKNRFLEAQLKSVEQRLKDLQAKWGKETEMVKDMYESELREAKNLYNEVEKEKARIELKIQSLEDQVAEYRRRLDDLERLRQQDKETINKQNQQLADYESELNMLRRRVNGLDQDLAYERTENKRLQDELFKATQERDNERLNNIDLQNQMQALQEEMDFLKNLHDQEMKELRQLISQDTYKDNRTFWEGEMSNAIRELQTEFDKRLDHQNQQTQNYYQMKVQEVKTGQAKDQNKMDQVLTETRKLNTTISDLKRQIGDLEGRNVLMEKQYNDLIRQHEEEMRQWDEDKSRYESEIERLTAECEKLLREMEVVMDSKLSLELEIAAYRKLLEVEENRMNMRDELEQLVETTETTTTEHSSMGSSMGGGAMGGGSMGGGSMGGGGGSMGGSMGGSIGGYGGGAGGSSSMMMSSSSSSSSGPGSKSTIAAGSMSQKTQFQRSAKGPLAIAQTEPTGLWIEVENTGRKDEDLSGWKVSRKVDTRTLPSFEFPEGLILGNTRDSRSVKIYAQGQGPAGALEFSLDSWGQGGHITTSLVSPNGEDKATHIQKTSYAQ